jgi:uncharacterized damage-inducible protein DinB
MKINDSNSYLTRLSENYVKANHWANQTLVAWLKTKPADLLEKEVASSFPGIRETLVHIWDTERFWLSVIRQEPAPQSFRMVPFRGTLDEVFAGLLETSKKFEDTVLSLGEAGLTEVLHLSTPWFTSTEPRFQFVQHAMNHSTYHRGQAITLGHHVGFHDAPMTDYNFYLVMSREQKAA